MSSARRTRRGLLAGLGAIAASSAFVLSAPHVFADPAPCAGLLTSSTTCTLAPGATLTFTLKGGDGGTGGQGGIGGLGGTGSSSMIFSPGGIGGMGGAGGDGGLGAKVTGTYTNTSNSTVTITVTVGADGATGTAGTPGSIGNSAPPMMDDLPGGPGGPGGQGGTGGNGSPTELYVDATLLVSAGGGTGGEGGYGGGGGSGGFIAPGSPGGSGVPGGPGTDGSALPSPLPNGWSLLTGELAETPFVSLDQTSPDLSSFGVASDVTTLTAICLIATGAVLACASRRRFAH